MVNNGKLLTKSEVKSVLDEGVREIDRRLHFILNEELGVSDDVKRFCSVVEQYVIDNKESLLDIPNGHETSVSFGFNGKALRITFYVFKCSDTMQEADLILNYPKAANANSVYRYGGELMLMTMPVVFVGRKLDVRKLYDDLQHEVSHIYQQSRSGKTYAKTEYNDASIFLYSDDECERNLARIIYLCHPTEQDAFVNGMYGYIMKALDNGEYPVDKSSISAYLELQNLYKAYDFVQRNRNTEEMKQALANLKERGVMWDIRKYLSRASEGIKEFERKIKRILMKCEKDAIILGYDVRSRKPGVWLY